MSRAETARNILATPLILELLHEFEATALSAVIYAKYDDHEARQANAYEARAIRNLLARLESISKEDQPKPVRQAPA
jgi:hypothetical protein